MTTPACPPGKPPARARPTVALDALLPAGSWSGAATGAWACLGGRPAGVGPRMTAHEAEVNGVPSRSGGARLPPAARPGNR